MAGYDYIREPDAIYAASFATIEAEAKLDGLTRAERTVAIRIVHACGMTDVAGSLSFAPGAVEAGVDALEHGAPVVCDVEMVRQGIIARRLPASNDVLCALGDDRTVDHAAALATTRTAAALDLLVDRWGGAIVAIGNAPTALFHLLEAVAAGAPRPALVVGLPVGFVGAVESKEALAASDLPFVTLPGRRGGSAMASAAVNALCGQGSAA